MVQTGPPADGKPGPRPHLRGPWTAAPSQEQLHQGLTLDEAIRLYQDSPRPEKRLGVTKDSIATVDIVRTADGEQGFFPDHQKLDSFRSDPTIFEAVERLHQELDAVAIDPSMTM